MDTAARRAEMLEELAELSLTLARKLQADAMTAETPEDAGLLTREFHRVARGLRQTLALQEKFERDARQAAREAAEAARKAASARALDRNWRVRARLQSLLWTEAERAEDLDLDGIDADEAEDALSMAVSGLMADPYVADRLASDEPVEAIAADLAGRVKLRVKPAARREPELEDLPPAPDLPPLRAGERRVYDPTRGWVACPVAALDDP